MRLLVSHDCLDRYMIGLSINRWVNLLMSKWISFLIDRSIGKWINYRVVIITKRFVSYGIKKVSKKCFFFSEGIICASYFCFYANRHI